jgi:hypothetical protein
MYLRWCLVILAGAGMLAAQPIAAQADPINIEKWPDDVPCNALKIDPDGTYEITVPFVRFFSVHNGAKYRNTRETRYWDQKCKGKTQ